MPRTITVGLDGSPESHATSLPVVHSWNPPPYYAYGLSCDLELHTEPARQEATTLTEVLRPWRQKFDRRIRRSPLGARIGPTTHAVLHHATAPVAVVTHG